MQFVCKFALENARNSVLELSMRAPINHKTLYYNYYTYIPPHTGDFACILTGMQRHLQQMPGDTLGGGDVL